MAAPKPIILNPAIVERWMETIIYASRFTHIRAIQSGHGYREYYADMGYNPDDVGRMAEEAKNEEKTLRKFIKVYAEEYIREWVIVFVRNYPTHRDDPPYWMPKFVWPYNGYGAGFVDWYRTGKRVAKRESLKTFLQEFGRGAMRGRLIKRHGRMDLVIGGLQMAYEMLRSAEKCANTVCVSDFYEPATPNHTSIHDSCDQCSDSMDSSSCTDDLTLPEYARRNTPARRAQLAEELNSDSDPDHRIQSRNVLIGLCGYAGSGKDTAAEALLECGPYDRRAFADKLKRVMCEINPFFPEVGMTYTELAESVGVEEAKRAHPCVRKMMVTIGESHRRVFGEHFWIDACLPRHGRLANEYVVVTDVRYPNEVARIKSMFGHVWYIDRPGCGPANETEAESIKLCKEMCTGTLTNEGSREGFMQNVGLLGLSLLRGIGVESIDIPAFPNLNKGCDV